MSNMRAIIVVAVPAVAAIFGLLWLFGRKKVPSTRKPPDKDPLISSDKTKCAVSKTDSYNGTAGKKPEKVPCGKSDADANVSEKSSKCKETVGSSGDTGNPLVDEELLVSRAQDIVKTAVQQSKEVLAKSEVQESMVSATTTVLSSVPSVGTSNSGNRTNSTLKSEVKETVASRVETSLNAMPSTSVSKSNQELPPSKSEPEQTPVEEMITPSSSQSVNAVKPPSPESKNEEVKVPSIINVDKKKSASSDSPNATCQKDIDTAKVAPISESVVKSRLETNGEDQESNSVSNDVNKDKPSDSMSRSWHEDVPEDSCDLNCNSVVGVAHENDNDKSASSSVEKSQKANATAVSNGSGSKTNGDEYHRSKHDRSSPPGRMNLKNKKKVLENETPPRFSKAQTRNQHHQDDTCNHNDNSSNCDNLSEASNDSGKGGSVQESNAVPAGAEEDRLFEFNIPSNMAGLFIGYHGKTIKQISQQSNTRIRLQHNPYTAKFQICVVEGTQNAIERACSIIRRKFPNIQFPGPEMAAPPSANPVIMPEIMQLSLPEGVSVDIVVSSIVDAGRIFVQQPTHPTFPSLERLNTFMNACYLQDTTIPDMPRPIETGVICAAPMLNGWYRAQIMAVYENTDECDIKYVDYGGYSRVSSAILKQIRSDFMTLPFEAIECYMANVVPLESEAFYSTESAVVLEELTQGKLLQATVVGRAEDGVPMINVFQVQPNAPSILVNREMVHRGVVRWMENVS